jgi:hypothetical protein
MTNADNGTGQLDFVIVFLALHLPFAFAFEFSGVFFSPSPRGS